MSSLQKSRSCISRQLSASASGVTPWSSTSSAAAIPPITSYALVGIDDAMQRSALADPLSGVSSATTRGPSPATVGGGALERDSVSGQWRACIPLQCDEPGMAAPEIRTITQVVGEADVVLALPHGREAS